MDAMVKALKKRGWSFHKLHVETGLSEQVLRNIAKVGASHETDTSRVNLSTFAKIAAALYPDLDIDDFIPRSELTVYRKDDEFLEDGSTVEA